MVCNLFTQDCLEYPEIEGAECAACVPVGWTPFSGTSPDIILDDGTWPGGPPCMINDLSGSSPSGGNMILLASIGASYQEGMTTTVSGLNTNQEYAFALYWEEVTGMGCPGNFGPGELLINIDGEEYDYSGSGSWELIEICFTPSSSSIDIEISINSSGDNVIVIDSPDCDEITPCCPLVIIYDEIEFEICPGDEFLIEGAYDNNVGGVVIEWTSDPEEGLDYLDATDIISPTFNFPEDDNFEGETYILTMIIEDDNCTKAQDIEVIVNANVVPEFEIIICELSFIDDFPTTSLNGYTGTWFGDFDFEDLIGTVQDYTFVLDPGQDNCIEEYTYEIPINPALELYFQYNDAYCVLDDEDYELPNRSEEDVKGEWDENDFNPSELGVGVFTFLFEPEPEYCAFPFEAEIEIFEESFLTFNIPETFCVSSQDYLLPTESLEGIVGTWDEEYIDLSSPVQEYDLYFTPEDVNDCYSNFQTSISIIETIMATFDISDTICRQNSELVFDSTSLEGIKGYWAPLAVNSDTVPQDFFTIQWIPLDASNNCLQGTSKTIIIKNPEILDINLPSSICRDNGNFILPTGFLQNGIIGNWNVSQFDPDTIIGSTIDLQFIPEDDQCIETYFHTINIIDNIDPQFNLTTELCSSDSNFTLPLTSNNNISGTWNVNEIQPSLINDQITSIFTPSDQTSCFNPFEVTFTITNLITPVFDLPEAFCEDGNNYIFPLVSVNNIEGTWTTDEFDILSYSENVFENIFTPIDISCNQIINISIPVINFNGLQNIVTNASSCAANDGSIIFTISSDFEYSIDNGITWQSDPLFDNLSAGIYQIISRHISFSQCFKNFDIQITAPSAPIIVMIEAIGISDCNATDGSAVCTAEGNNLEYSIDGGLTWHLDNSFNDLSVGDYNLLVRSDGDSNCSTQQSFTIEDISEVEIEDVIVTNISDCQLTDGQIFVLPENSDYEYSIDNNNWQSSNIFADLNEGQYLVTIRLVVSPNCFDNLLVNITSPSNPIIIDLSKVNPSDCGTEDGSISIEASGIDLEYSIDNGISWSSSNDFSNLPSGVYNVIIREVNAPNCVDESSITLETPNTPEVTNFELKQPTDCISNDGSITITTSNSDVEFSIDDGANWQSNGIFENLEPRNYLVIVRNVISIDCTTSLTFEINEVPCPCNDLDIEIRVVDANCFNPNSGQIEIINIDGFFTNEDYNLLWSTGSSELIIDNLSSGWYTYEISYDKNCTFIDSVFLDSFDPIDFALLSFDPNCNEGGSIEVTDLEGGNGLFQFSLDGINFQDNNVFINLTAAAYEVLIEDNFDCSESRNITLNPIDNLSLDLPQIQPIAFGETVFLNPLINQTTLDSFSWSPISGILNPQELIAQVSPEQTTEYTLTIYFGDCVETRTITVEVIENSNIYLGNMFSPNFDGNNDYFFIQSSERNNNSIIEFSIFDRWGNKVFTKLNPEINNEKDGWDGSFGSKDAEIGVYTYFIKYEVKNSTDIIAGTITLTR